MFLVVGLGNPGSERENDRHNVGFVVVQALARSLGASDFRSKFDGQWTRAELAGHDVAMLLPHTYMNLSGQSVQPAMAYFKIPAENLIVVHDELDLPWQEVRLKLGGGHAGHNGVRSLLERLGTPGFVRVRIGIGKPPSVPSTTTIEAPLVRTAPSTRAFVLSSFDSAERAVLPEVVARALEAVRRVVTEGIAAAQTAANASKKK